MRIKDIFVVETIDDKKYMVCLDNAVLSGMIKLNETAAFIVDCLKEETTIDEIANKIVSVYEVEKEDAINAVEKVIDQFKKINALDY